MRRRVLIIIACLTVLTILFIIAELLFIKYNGAAVITPEIPRQPLSLGAGPPLTYVVMGDSTSIGEGADYKDSYSLAGARHLAEKYQVKFINLGVSGATVADVLKDQVPKALSYKPDVALIAAGANDATHFTGDAEIQRDLRQIVAELKKANEATRIIVTRSPAMDSVSRFPWPVRQLMGLRTRQVNAAFQPVVNQYELTVAPIAEKTRQAFLDDPSLLASDKFHPNGRGYALWIPVINQALDEALTAQPL